MSNEELVELIWSSQGEEKKAAMTTLYNKNRNLIAMIARKYTGIAEFQDLMQEAFFGLLAAVESFDSKGDVSFAAYMVNAITWTLYRYVNTYCNTIRIPESQKMQILHYRRLCDQYEKQLNRKPTDQEAAYHLGLTVQQITDLRTDTNALYISSTEERIAGDDDGLTIADTIKDPGDDMADTLERIQGEQLQRFLWRKVDDLGRREARILRGRFQEGKTLADMAKELNISQERVRAIQNGLIKKLRKDKEIRDYIEDAVESIAYHNISLASFRHSFTSAPERAVMFKEEKYGLHNGNC